MRRSSPKSRCGLFLLWILSTTSNRSSDPEIQERKERCDVPTAVLGRMDLDVGLSSDRSHQFSRLSRRCGDQQPRAFGQGRPGGQRLRKHVSVIKMRNDSGLYLGREGAGHVRSRAQALGRAAQIGAARGNFRCAKRHDKGVADDPLQATGPVERSSLIVGVDQLEYGAGRERGLSGCRVVGTGSTCGEPMGLTSPTAPRRLAARAASCRTISRCRRRMARCAACTIRRCRADRAAGARAVPRNPQRGGGCAARHADLRAACHHQTVGREQSVLRSLRFAPRLLRADRQCRSDLQGHGLLKSEP